MQVLVYICSTIPHLFCVSRFCSRYGLREIELLELLAPPGLTQLPHALWARLSKSLDAYTKLFETQDVSTLRFFHQQISRAVAARYLDTARSQHSVHRRLMRFFARKVSCGEAELRGSFRLMTMTSHPRRIRWETLPGLVTTSETLVTLCTIS